MISIYIIIISLTLQVDGKIFDMFNIMNFLKYTIIELVESKIKFHEIVLIFTYGHIYFQSHFH